MYSVMSPRLVSHPIAEYITRLQYSTRTNIFVLNYTSEKRFLKLLEKAPPIYPWNTHQDPCYVIANPVIGEVGVSLLRVLRTKSEVIALDLQGLVRSVTSSGDVVLTPHSEALDALRLVDVVHADVEEAECLVRGLGETSLQRGLSAITRTSRVVILITRGLGEITVAYGGLVRDVVVDVEYVAREKTGAGDYFLSVYLLHYLASNDLVESVYRAHEDVTEWLIERDRVLHRAPTTQ